MSSQETLIDALNQINTTLFNLATHFVHQKTVFDEIKAVVGKVKKIMRTTVLKLQDLTINFDVTASASEEVEYQKTSIDTNSTEQMIAASTKSFKIYDLLQEYGEDFFALSSAHSISLLDIIIL